MSKPQVGFDSCCILHLLIGTPMWISRLNAIVAQAKRNEIELIVSEISVVECVKLKTVAGDPVDQEKADADIRQFFNSLIRRATIADIPRKRVGGTAQARPDESWNV